MKQSDKETVSALCTIVLYVIFGVLGYFVLCKIIYS